jgi:N-acetylglucosamine-6-phosphate deacetylase
LEAGLVEEGLTSEIIADGYHLPSSLIKMAYRMKGVEKLSLVSDAMRASGMGPGEYQVGGLTALVEEGGGVAILPDRTAFAGSISTVLQCLQHVVLVVGLSLGDALQMATLTPARTIGVADRVGRLAPGCYADLLILDRLDLAPRLIVLGGQPVGGRGL